MVNFKKKILFLFGTRPEAIKMAPIIKAFQNDNYFISKVCVTGQHREMLDQVLDFFEIKPDYDLEVMRPNQDLFDLSANLLIKLKKVFKDFKPDYIFVHGDTTTSMIGSIGAYYIQAQLVHVEAGLRTQNKWSPFPEEINRQITGRIADIHLAPTTEAQKNLTQENINENQILITGNTVIDALYYTREKVKNNIPDFAKNLDFSNKKIILVTGHRRENFGNGIASICKGLLELSQQYKDIQIVYPIHLNPNVQNPVHEILGNKNNILLIDPLPYTDFVWLMSKSYLIITDSGGVQEEAPSLGKPVLVTRDTTERPEAIKAGTVKLIGANQENLKREVAILLNDSKIYSQMSKAHNPYGDGKAAVRILDYLKSIQ